MSKRLKFFIGHLLTSLLIACVAMSVIFFIWYPAPLAKAVGVTHIFLMMLAIDVIVGPLLGLLVYKEGKKSLKFDLTVIIVIQITALIFGMYNIGKGRPAWIAYNVDRFELVRYNDIVQENISQALPQYQKPSWLKPQYVAVEFAKDTKQRNNDMFAEVLGGISLAQRPERYLDFVQATDSIKQRAIDLNQLVNFNDAQKVHKVLTKYPQANGFLPLKASELDMTVLVDKGTGQVIKIVDLRPWED